MHQFNAAPVGDKYNLKAILSELFFNHRNGKVNENHWHRIGLQLAELLWNKNCITDNCYLILVIGKKTISSLIPVQFWYYETKMLQAATLLDYFHFFKTKSFDTKLKLKYTCDDDKSDRHIFPQFCIFLCLVKCWVI